MVGERSVQGRSGTARSRGPDGSANAGMSSEKQSENLCHRKPKVSQEDEPCLGNRRLSVTEILTLFFATHAGIRTSASSTTPYGIASPNAERSSTIRLATNSQLRYQT